MRKNPACGSVCAAGYGVVADRVLIDGINYVPESRARACVGVGVTTLNRPDVLATTLQALCAHTPAGFPIVVVDDGSTVPVTVPDRVQLIRHDVTQGIPAAKNACITALMGAGVEHLLLLDDDTYPCDGSWWQGYVASPEPHLQYSWLRFAKDKSPVAGMTEVYRDTDLVAYTHSMGCLLYVERRVIDAVGGMRWEFGAGYEEHLEWSERIHAAGFTSFTHQDLATTPAIYASDEHYAVQRSVSAADRSALVERNAALRAQLSGSTDYVEYRAMRDVVLTSYFANHPDPQHKNAKRPASPAVLDRLIASVGAPDLVVLHNCFDSLPCENVRQDCPMSPYIYRWLAQWRWLREHPEIDACWLVDATDVVMLNDPFPHMKPDTLYCGWEPTVLDCKWTRTHCPEHLKDWVRAHGHLTLLNTGVVGGTRAVLLAVCQAMIDGWLATDRTDPLYEMTLFNHVVRHQDREVVTGPQVTTVFKSLAQSDPHAWFSHK